MSEIINNSEIRKKKLKELILKLHSGESQEKVRHELIESLSKIPYGEVVEVEQELIEDGLPSDEVLKLCDVHSAVLQGNIDLTKYKDIPEGHPVHVMINENKELKKITAKTYDLILNVENNPSFPLNELKLKLREYFNALFDVDKHYQRKEYLIFPYLEKKGITGPPKVMWGKHDEIRELIKGSIEILKNSDISYDEFLASADLILKPTLKNIDEMIIKEEEILFPMLMDSITESEWYEISKQSKDIGFCLYDPPKNWIPDKIFTQTTEEHSSSIGAIIQLTSGSFNIEELESILNTIPFDITFVDRNDKVKYFSQSKDRIFQRTRAIINRDVRMCHPPASVHIVDKILEDFKKGHQNSAAFWINMKGRMIFIEYIALRNNNGEYLGTLEVSHDITRYRELQGERRILSYE
jgi:DUF438 domain-containing protein